MSVDKPLIRPGRIFIVLWAFTVLVEIISLQVRLAIFGGTGWLTSIKFATFGAQIGFTACLAVLCAALCGLWTVGFIGISRLFHASAEKTLRRCATWWIVILTLDLILRHKVGELLGNAFDFFEFATGVGGVWRMLEQAFQWYGDVIAIIVVSVIVVGVATYFFFRWFFKPREKISALDKIPKAVVTGFTITTFIASLLLMSVFAPRMPDVQKILAGETIVGAVFNVIVNVGTDFDRDGYGAFELPPDEMPFDASIHPHAPDNPDDGIDQDQILGDFSISSLSEQTKKRIDAQGTPVMQSYVDRRNVVIVLMESVRYDMLDATVDGQYVMPEMRKFIDRGAIRVDNAFASRGFTQNSVTQTLNGSYFETETSLVDDFKKLGYYTAVFNGESLKDEGFDESCGWNRAGDTIVDPRNIEANIYHHQSVPASVLMNEAEKFLDAYDTSKPLFLYVFYQDPHFPYQQDNPPVLTDREIRRSEITAQTRPRLWRTYANQVHHLDMAAGRLIRALDDKKMLDNSLVIFISDHGESLFDDGYLLGHGIAIQDTMTHAVMTIWGAHHDIPILMTHADIRKFIQDDFGSKPKKPEFTDKAHPIMQYIGSTTVPSAISQRFADGSRITWEFASQSAWRETTNASFPNQSEKRLMPQHGNMPVDAKIDVAESLEPTGIFRSPIDNPLEDPMVQNMIHEWEYMQWKHWN